MLGDQIAAALERVGISSQSVEKWLGRPCNCDERREKLNQLDTWARRVIIGNRPAKAVEYLNSIMGISE